MAPSTAAAISDTPEAGILVTDGPVHAVAHGAGRTFIGGDFSHVGLRTGVGAPLDAASGAASGPYPEVAGGVVRAAVADGAGGWYIGGTFTHVDGVPRSGLAHINPDGSLDPGWDPSPDGPVEALVRSATGPDAGVLYVGGSFTSIGGREYPNLAAIGSDGKALQSFAPKPDGEVLALARTHVTLKVNGNDSAVPVVFAGGSFAKVGSQDPDAQPDLPRAAAVWGVGARSETDASIEGHGATGWKPGADGTVRALALGPAVPASGDKLALPVYLGGDSTGSKHLFATRFQLAVAARAVDDPSPVTWQLPPTGCPDPAPAGAPPCAKTVRAIAATGSGADSRVYVGGDFSMLGDQPREKLGSVPGVADPTQDFVPAPPPTNWKPDADAPVRRLLLTDTTIYAAGDFRNIGGAPRETVAAVTTTSDTANAIQGFDARAVGGRVGAIALSDDASELYAGGDFISLGAVARANLAAVKSDGTLDQSWGAQANGGVRALRMSPDGATLYAGGAFDQLGGEERRHLGAVDAASGTVGGWRPDPDGDVLAIATLGSTVYAGGDFANIGSPAKPRSRIAALDAGSGTATDWNPGANEVVRAIAPACDVVYAGGSFTSIGGAERSRLAALDPSTGAASDWNPAPTSVVYAVARAGQTVYAGGAFTFVGGAIRHGVAAIEAATGKATAWNPSAEGPAVVRALALSADSATVYAAGAFTSIRGDTRHRLAAIEAASGSPTPWNPDADAFVRALDITGGTLRAGGDFRQVGTGMQAGLASFANASAPAGEPLPCAAPEPPPPPPPEPPAPESPPPPPPDVTPPVLSSFGIADRAFRVRGRATRRGGRVVRVGTTFTYRVSEPGAAKILIERVAAGRRVGKACVKPAPALRRARPCRRHLGTGTVTHNARRKGSNRMRFSGRLSKKRVLARGTYRATMTFTDAAGNVSKPRRLEFEVVG